MSLSKRTSRWGFRTRAEVYNYTMTVVAQRDAYLAEVLRLRRLLEGES